MLDHRKYQFLGVAAPCQDRSLLSSRRGIATTAQGDPVAALRWIVAGCGLALATALLVLAVPRTIAAWKAIPAGLAFDKLGGGRRPTTAELRDGVGALQRSVAIITSGHRLVELGTLEFQQALEMLPNNLARRALLENSEEHLTAGLRDNPADGTAWYRLAQVRQSHIAPPREVAVALMQSLDMAPNARWLWLSRARSFYEYASVLQEDELLAVGSQFRTIWRSEPRLREPLLWAAEALGNMQLLSSALESDAEAKSELQTLRRGASSK